MVLFHINIHQIQLLSGVTDPGKTRLTLPINYLRIFYINHRIENLELVTTNRWQNMVPNHFVALFCTARIMSSCQYNNKIDFRKYHDKLTTPSSGKV